MVWGVRASSKRKHTALTAIDFSFLRHDDYIDDVAAAHDSAAVSPSASMFFPSTPMTACIVSIGFVGGSSITIL